MDIIDPRVLKVISRWYWIPWDYDLSLGEKVFLIEMIEAGAYGTDVLLEYFPDRRKTDNLKDRLLKFLAPGEIMDMAESNDVANITHWRQFEIIVAELFQSLGYEVELTRRVKDSAIDIFAVRNYVTNDSYLIQCKLSNGKIGVKVVREMLGVLEDSKATKAVIISNQGFTREAKNSYNETDGYLKGKTLKTYFHGHSIIHLL